MNTKRKYYRIKNARGLESTMPILYSGQVGFAKDTHKIFLGTGEQNIEITDEELIHHVESTEAHPAAHILVTQIQGIDATNIQSALEQLGIREHEIIELVYDVDDRIDSLILNVDDLNARLDILDEQVLELQDIIESLDHEKFLSDLDILKISIIDSIDGRLVHKEYLGVPNGLATLDGNGRIPESMLPAVEPGPTPEVQENKDVANGYCGLDANGYVLTTYIYPISIRQPIVDNSKEYTDKSISEVNALTTQSVNELLTLVDTGIGNVKNLTDTKVKDVQNYASAELGKIKPFRYGMINTFLGCALGGSDGKRLVTSKGTVDNDWCFCDGTNGTPNLTNKLLYATATPAAAGTINNYWATVPANAMPSHTHTGESHYHGFSFTTTTDNNHVHSMPMHSTRANGATAYFASSSNANLGSWWFNVGGSHAHTFSVNSGYNSAANTGATGSGAALTLIQPYYQSLYFMFVGG